MPQARTISIWPTFRVWARPRHWSRRCRCLSHRHNVTPLRSESFRYAYPLYSNFEWPLSDMVNMASSRKSNCDEEKENKNKNRFEPQILHSQLKLIAIEMKHKSLKFVQYFFFNWSYLNCKEMARIFFGLMPGMRIFPCFIPWHVLMIAKEFDSLSFAECLCQCGCSAFLFILFTSPDNRSIFSLLCVTSIKFTAIMIDEQGVCSFGERECGFFRKISVISKIWKRIFTLVKQELFFVFFRYINDVE